MSAAVDRPNEDWDERTVAIWKNAIALVAAFDVVTLVVRTIVGAREHRRWSGGLGALADHPLAVAAIGVVGVVGAVGLFRRPNRARWPLLVLVVTAVLHDVFGRVFGVFHETYYQGGAALFGWAAGLGWARAIGGATEGTRRDDAATTRWAARGALAALAATYVGAGVSKLVDSGLGWADADALRLIVMSHLPVAAHGVTDRLEAWLVERPGVARASSVAGLVVELGAWTMLLGRWGRRVTGGLLFAFHVGTWLLARVFFPEAALLLAAVAVPWSRVLRGTADDRNDATSSVPPMPSLARVSRVFAAGLAALIAVVLALHAAPFFPRAHPIEAVASTSPTTATPSMSASASSSTSAVAPAKWVVPSGRESQVLALAAPYRLGDPIAVGFVLDDLSIADTAFTYRVRRGDDTALVRVAIDTQTPPPSPPSWSASAIPDDASDAGRAAKALRDVVTRALGSEGVAGIVVAAGGS